MVAFFRYLVKPRNIGTLADFIPSIQPLAPPQTLAMPSSGTSRKTQPCNRQVSKLRETTGLRKINMRANLVLAFRGTFRENWGL